jgi:hypothetical protein
MQTLDIRNVILHVVFHGYKTRSLIFRKKQRPKLFEEKVLKNILEPQRDEVTGAGEECTMSTSSNIVRFIKSGRMRWAGHVVRVRHRRGTRRVLVVRRDRQ